MGNGCTQNSRPGRFTTLNVIVRAWLVLVVLWIQIPYRVLARYNDVRNTTDQYDWVLQCREMFSTDLGWSSRRNWVFVETRVQCYIEFRAWSRWALHSSEQTHRKLYRKTFVSDMLHCASQNEQIKSLKPYKLQAKSIRFSYCSQWHSN